jgi:hypothetical protein
METVPLQVNKMCGANQKTMLTTMKYVQINLHYSKAGMAALCQKLVFGNVGIALVPTLFLETKKKKSGFSKNRFVHCICNLLKESSVCHF